MGAARRGPSRGWRHRSNPVPCARWFRTGSSLGRERQV